MGVSIYCRVSSDDQRERGTVENQIEFGRKYADLHQLDISDWYIDDGVTGTIPLEQRPEGNRLLQDAQEGKVKLLLIYKLDRLGRSARVVLNAVHELENYGVKIRSMTEPFDTSDPSGRFLLTILAGVADLEHDTILERMSLGTERAARAGKWLGGIVPFGYITLNGYLKINDAEAEIVRLIFRLVANDHYSAVQVADYLNAVSIYSRNGPWVPNTVWSIVTSQTYKGIHLFGKNTNKQKELIVRKVPAIVTEETWDRAQEVLQEHKQIGFKAKTREYLLTGLIKCGSCGLHYVGTNTRNRAKAGGKKPYYVCTGKSKYKGPLNGKCNSKNLPAEWIEDLVWEECLKFIRNPGDALRRVAETMKIEEQKTDGLEKEIGGARKSLEKKSVERSMIADLYRRGLLKPGEVEDQLQKIAFESAALEQRIKELEFLSRDQENLKEQFGGIEKALTDMQQEILNPDLAPEIKKGIIRILTKEIIVMTKKKDGKPRATVNIYFRFAQVIPKTVERSEYHLDKFLVKKAGIKRTGRENRFC